MTFAEVLAALEACEALPASRLKDCKTSLRYLASALGAASLEACPVTDACRDEARWGPALEGYWQRLMAEGRQVSGSTRRNTKNNCRKVWKLAEGHCQVVDLAS